MRGPVGLNYSGIEACMRMRGIRGSARSAMFEQIQVMERASLQAWANET